MTAQLGPEDGPSLRRRTRRPVRPRPHGGPAALLRALVALGVCKGAAPMSAIEPTRTRPSETVAGFLAAMAIFICLIGIAWHPLRLILPDRRRDDRRRHRRQVPAARVRGRPDRRRELLLRDDGRRDHVARALVKPARPATTHVDMSRPEVDGLNTGYAALLLEQYLDNPSAVPSEWRALFESAPEALLAIQPGLARLLERNGGNGHVATAGRRRAAPARAGAGTGAPHPWPHRHRRRPTTSCSAASRRRCRSSRPTARTATSRRISTRSARSRPAIPRSSPSG